MFSLPSELRSRIWVKARHMRIGDKIAPHLELLRKRLLIASRYERRYGGQASFVFLPINTNKIMCICRCRNPEAHITWVSKDIAKVTVRLYVLDNEASSSRSVMCWFDDRRCDSWVCLQAE